VLLVDGGLVKAKT